MSITPGNRGAQAVSRPTTWTFVDPGKTGLSKLVKPAGINFSDVAAKDKETLATIDAIPIENMTLAPKREYMPNIFKVDDDKVEFAKEFNTMQLGTPPITITWNDDVVVATGILNSVKFHNIIGKTTRVNTKDALKLLCLVTGADIGTTNDQHRIDADGLVTRAMFALGSKKELLLSTYARIMNDGNLTYLRNRRYFPPALKDLADAYYLETNYKGYWDFLFKDSKFTVLDMYVNAFNYANLDAAVYTLNYFHKDCDKNIEEFRSQFQSSFDRSAAGLLVVKEKRENVPFPTEHKRFGERANKRHIYIMAKNAWDEHVRLERSKEYMNI